MRRLRIQQLLVLELLLSLKRLPLQLAPLVNRSSANDCTEHYDQTTYNRDTDQSPSGTETEGHNQQKQLFLGLIDPYITGVCPSLEREMKSKRTYPRRRRNRAVGGPSGRQGRRLLRRSSLSPSPRFLGVGEQRARATRLEDKSLGPNVSSGPKG